MFSFLIIFEIIILFYVKRVLIKVNIDLCIMYMYIVFFEIMIRYCFFWYYDYIYGIVFFDIMIIDIVFCDIMVMFIEVNVVDMCIGEFDMYLY